jgi:hypothetical protein
MSSRLENALGYSGTNGRKPSCSTIMWSSLTSSNREKILPLVSRVSGARYRNFSTRGDAEAYYLDAKKDRLVTVVRDPGDDVLFGPLCDAMQ